jgi:transcriptional regulator with XRE-family HTH domain
MEIEIIDTIMEFAKSKIPNGEKKQILIKLMNMIENELVNDSLESIKKIINSKKATSLSKKSGVNRSIISMFKNGRYRPTLRKILEIETALIQSKAELDKSRAI